MKIAIESAVVTWMARLLAVDPALTKADAVIRATDALKQSDLRFEPDDIARLSSDLTRHAVINPVWLASHGMRPHIVLAEAPGALATLEKATDLPTKGLSTYIVYGDFDSLIILYGTDQEAAQLSGATNNPVYRNVTYVTVDAVPYAYRYRTRTPNPDRHPGSVIDVVNSLVADCSENNEAAFPQFDDLIADGVLLGSTWRFAGGSSLPLQAFVGIRLIGTEQPGPNEVLEHLLSREPVRGSLVHLFHCKPEVPYSYYAKLECRTMAELDIATDAINYLRIGRSRLDTNTQVVATGRDQLPTIRLFPSARIAIIPDVADIADLLPSITDGLPDDLIKGFNSLPTLMKVCFIRNATELTSEYARGGWTKDTATRMGASVDSYLRSTLVNGERPAITGSVTEVSTAVEGISKRLLSKCLYLAFDGGPAEAQNIFRLPHKKVADLTLRVVAVTLTALFDHPAAARLPDLEGGDTWLQRLEHYVPVRNLWHHDAAPDLIGPSFVDDGREALVEGMQLARWLESAYDRVASHDANAPSAAETLDLSEIERTSPPTLPVERELLDVLEAASPNARRREDHEYGVFLSHSSKDKAVAGRLANGLGAMGYSVWYDDWALAPGDSIIDKVADGLAASDTLVVLLSPHSIASRWVQKELAVALTDELNGRDVAVVAVVIEDCDIPPTLTNKKYIRMHPDQFETGFRQLSDFLRTRKDRDL